MKVHSTGEEINIKEIKMRTSLCEMYELSRFHGAFFTALKGTHQHSNIRFKRISMPLKAPVEEGTLSSIYALGYLLQQLNLEQQQPEYQHKKQLQGKLTPIET